MRNLFEENDALKPNKKRLSEVLIKCVPQNSNRL